MGEKPAHTIALGYRGEGLFHPTLQVPFLSSGRSACLLMLVLGGVYVQGTPAELLHYANLIILSDMIDVSNHCEMKFGRQSGKDSTCNF